MNQVPTYFDYYNKLVGDNALFPAKGFKLVLGGTGLGKTRGIVEVIKEHLNGPYKFIYMANRIHLLNDLAKDLASNIGPDAFVHQVSDRDAVLGVFQRSDLRGQLYDFFADNRTASASSALKAADEIERLLSLNALHEDAVSPSVYRNSKTLLDFFEGIYKKHYSSEDNPSNPLLNALFPYAQFERQASIKVALVTIQKAYRGMFNGSRRVNLTNLGEDQNYVIFMDEFDFLEHELIELICDSTQIEDPFRFVEFFYNAMTRHKLPLDEYPFDQKNIRDRILDIIGQINLLRREGIPYPDINQFTRHTPGDEIAIFQSSRTYINGSLYLRVTDRSYEVVKEPEDDTFQPLQLFGKVRTTSNRILTLLKELESLDERIYQEVKRQCFGRTDYFQLLDRVGQLPVKHRAQRTRFDNLLEQGFGVYEIEDLQQLTDRYEVTFNHYAIHTTPEKLLSLLTKNNLVFGLSATADLPRHVRNFSLSWLRRQNDVNFFEVDADDFRIIHVRNEEKSTKRDNQISLETLHELASDDPFQKRLIDFIEAISTMDEDFGGSTHYHRRRVARFFTALIWNKERRQRDSSVQTHLMFFNTFKQILHLFSSYPDSDGFLYTVQPRDEDNLFRVFELDFLDETYIIVFYDSEQARRIRTSEEARETYESLFWEGHPVVVVTQYQSAGNGVNLQFRPSNDSPTEQDFSNIYLLDTPYFYFGRSDRNAPWNNQNRVFKHNAWYLGKLFEANIISWHTFRHSLQRLRGTAGHDLNDFYFASPDTAADATYNQVATFIQALGRIERVWDRMTDQTVVVCPEVFEILQRFCLKPRYEQVYESHRLAMSNNVRSIFDIIIDNASANQRRKRQQRDERLRNQNVACEEAINNLLVRLSALRRGSKDSEARADWEQLREAVLRHDYYDEILSRYPCVFQTDFIRNNQVQIDENLYLYPSSPTEMFVDTTKWNLDSVYSLPWMNATIRSHFEENEYQMGFDGEAGFMYVPCCYQSILSGAIGEESVRAILKAEQISVESLPDQLFETADMKISGFPWLIDAKFFSERTMDSFSLPSSASDWHHRLNDHEFRRTTSLKIEAIHHLYASDSIQPRLIFLNAFSTDDRPIQFFDYDFNPAESFAVCDVAIVPGVLRRDHPELYTAAFEIFLAEIRSEMRNLERYEQ